MRNEARRLALTASVLSLAGADGREQPWRCEVARSLCGRSLVMSFLWSLQMRQTLLQQVRVGRTRSLLDFPLRKLCCVG